MLAPKAAVTLWRKGVRSQDGSDFLTRGHWVLAVPQATQVQPQHPDLAPLLSLKSYFQPRNGNTLFLPIF